MQVAQITDTVCRVSYLDNWLHRQTDGGRCVEAEGTSLMIKGIFPSCSRLVEKARLKRKKTREDSSKKGGMDRDEAKSQVEQRPQTSKKIQAPQEAQVALGAECRAVR